MGYYGPSGLPVPRCKIVLQHSSPTETELWVEETYEQVKDKISRKEVFIEVHRVMPITESNPQTVKVLDIVTYRPVEYEEPANA